MRRFAESWDASWENNVRLAQLADEVGIECMIPIARWKGYEGESNPNGSSFESIAWACGLLASTRRINVFCTVHVPLHHPVAAAKQMATADHIGQGRLGVNIVCGWNEDEFQMFGVSQHEHDERYAQGEEWWSIVKRIWTGSEPFDYDGHVLSTSRRGRIANALWRRRSADDERRQLTGRPSVRHPSLGYAFRWGRHA